MFRSTLRDPARAIVQAFYLQPDNTNSDNGGNAGEEPRNQAGEEASEGEEVEARRRQAIARGKKKAPQTRRERAQALIEGGDYLHIIQNVRLASHTYPMSLRSSGRDSS